MIDFARDRNKIVPAWWVDWNDQVCVIVASGPSAKDQPLHLLKKANVKTVAINSSFRLVPNADILFACDHKWWKNHLAEVNGFQGLKLTTDTRYINQDWGIHRVMCDRMTDQFLMKAYNHVGWGGNSGFQALNLVLQFGISRVILVGYDMNLKGGTHWHGDHPEGMKNPNQGNINRWKRAIDNAAPIIARYGVEVVNASVDSALEAYQKMTFEEALEWAL